MELFRLLDSWFVLKDYFATGREGEIVFLIAGAAEPEMLEDFLFTFSDEDSDDTAVAEVV